MEPRSRFAADLMLLLLVGSTPAATGPVVVGRARFTVVTPECIRLEYAPTGAFVNTPSLFAVGRSTQSGFRLVRGNGRTVIDTGAIRLVYTPDGKPFSARNLQARTRRGDLWRPGAPNPGNLGGTVQSLDGKSDHDHLGKLITYASVHGAASAVWIAEEPRPEHATAVNWLNESMPTRFYFVKAEAVKIGDSAVAPVFTLIVGPNAETKAVGVQKEGLAKESSQDDDLRQAFWSELYKRCAGVLPKFASKVPGTGPWSATSVGGYSYQMWVYVKKVVVELRIDFGKDSEDQNGLVFDELLAQREQIEGTFGESLEWDRMDAHRACRVTKRLGGAGFRSPQEEWPALQDSMIDATRRLMEALSLWVK